MKLTMNIKPRITKAGSKDLVMRKALAGKSKRYSRAGVYYQDIFSKRQDVTVFTLEKHNPKFIQHRYKTGPKKGQYKKSTKVSSKTWIIHTYTIKYEVVEALKLKFIQGNRTFKMVQA